MGVRFQCPNGHALHVKASLAGKRGICPACNAKFIVPSFNGGRARAVVESVGASGDGTQSDSVDPSGSTVIAAIASSSKLAAPPSFSDAAMKNSAREGESPPLPSNARDQPKVQWYVRPAAGGQYGPATTEEFQQWIADGRVDADSLVWRTGWPDWKRGAEATPLAERQTADHPPAINQPRPAPNELPVQLDAHSSRHGQPMTAQAYRDQRRRRNERAQRLTLGLALVTVILAVVLAIVLNR